MDLTIFSRMDFPAALKAFFESLHVPVHSLTDEPGSGKTVLRERWKDNASFNLIKDVYFVGMVDDNAFAGKKSIDVSKIRSEVRGDYDGVIIFGVILNQRDADRLPTRSQLAEITRAFNREYYYTPVIVVFQYDKYLAFANAKRLKYKQEWREGEKVGRVSLLRDIDIENPHAGHMRILNDLKIPKTGKNKVKSFATLYAYWQDVFSVGILNKKFYQELSNWYFWAVEEVAFPSEPMNVELRQEHNAKNVIRLLTRLLFVWFIKEKNLIPEELFDIDYLKEELLKDFKPFQTNTESVYYKAVLQNLFFASLNCPIKTMGDGDTRKRGFRIRNKKSRDKNFGVTHLMRYENKFKNHKKFLDLMNSKVPFLNGGLFECLDFRGEKEKKEERHYIDGFSDNLVKPHKLIVPDYLFFTDEHEVDLSDVAGIKTKAFKNACVKGLIPILESYKFTIAENTPIEEDVALDPELLGKVFENLLASYNPETKTTARKQTGSFYTPREIVNYMVDESLIAHLKNSVKNWDIEEDAMDKRLHELLSYDAVNPFAENNDPQKEIINALDNCKILDPACGSGAFPMGILQKMVHVLQKVDPDNIYWKELQVNKAEKEAKDAFAAITDKEEREQRLKDINDAFDEKINDPDYARKLFLIEDCIYGVDIQEIAVQISKLRFFISLVVDQKVDKSKDNFGIRALPNLETKFVAANTLIGIAKPENQKKLFDNKEINKLENELKDIRRKIFSALSPQTKRTLRAKDKKIRDKIGKLLIQHGWANETAKQLASWDPYDQNSSSPFFDPEWMFGVRDGFDVIIGNPPYKILTKNNTIKTELDSYLKKYHSIKKASSKNIYTLFIENSIELLKHYSHLSFIVPEGLYQTRSYIGCVQIMEKCGSTTQVVTFSDFVFENAVTGNLIFLYQKQLGIATRTFHFDKNYSLSEKQIVQRKDISEIEKDCVELKSVATTFKGMVVKDRNKVLTDERGDAKNLFLLGKNISKWRITSYLYTDYERLVIVGGTKKIEKHNQVPRILIRRTGNTICCAFLKEAALTESTLYSLWSKNSDYTNLYLLGLLNSTLINHYNKTLNITNRQGFPQILMTDLQLLPIRRPVVPYKTHIEFLVSAMLFQTNAIIESILNSIVFELYFPDHMKERNIDILRFVEKDWEEVMQGGEFDRMTDDGKEKVINGLHERWTDPAGEIVRRMESFAEKSPDILKPILEG